MDCHASHSWVSFIHEYRTIQIASPIQNPERSGIALRREVAGCQQARSGLAGPERIIVANYRNRRNLSNASKHYQPADSWEPAGWIASQGIDWPILDTETTV